MEIGWIIFSTGKRRGRLPMRKRERGIPPVKNGRAKTRFRETMNLVATSREIAKFQETKQASGYLPGAIK